MKRFSIALLVACACAMPPAFADDAQDVATAETVATAWLLQNDQARYADSYDGASSIVKMSVSKPDWLHGMQSARDPLGSVVSRKLVDAKFTHTVPGAPDGSYVILRFQTTFQNKPSVVETVTPMKDSDGQWRVSGYFMN